jgi:hypothetical protein
MINIQQFKELQKNSSRSYHQQKSLIKKVIAGKPVNCEVCGGLLELRLSDKDALSGIFCPKRCTEIYLEIN